MEYSCAFRIGIDERGRKRTWVVFECCVDESDGKVDVDDG
jgi:hypothetical protein